MQAGLESPMEDDSASEGSAGMLAYFIWQYRDILVLHGFSSKHLDECKGFSNGW